MKNKIIELYADAAPFQETLAELLALAKTSQTSSEVIQRFFDSASQVELISFEQKVTVGTSDLVLVIKPSDKLLEFLGTLRTSEGELLTADAK